MSSNDVRLEVDRRLDQLSTLSLLLLRASLPFALSTPLIDNELLEFRDAERK